MFGLPRAAKEGTSGYAYTNRHMGGEPPGLHIAAVMIAQAEEAVRRALRDWDATILRGTLSDLPIEWLCTSPEYA